MKVAAVLGKCRLNIRLQTLICSRFNEHLSHCHWSNALLWILLPLLHRSGYRRKFRSQTSDNVDKWKSRGGKSQRREQQQKEDQRREDAGARKGRKVAIHCVFPMVCGSGGSKSRLAKVAGARPSGQMRDEKLHAVVARSTFRSQNVQNTPGSDHFWKVRCRKSARRCGAKHISTFRMAGARDCAPCQRRAKPEGFVAISTTTTTTLHSTTLQLELQLQLRLRLRRLRRLQL